MDNNIIKKYMDDCSLCPRNCHVNRSAGQRGYCGASATLKAARAALHMWEEPCISGTRGSGAVFFSGCNMHCVFCQNEQIAKGQFGIDLSVERFVEILLNFQEQGAANINLVTPTHFVPQIIQGLEQAKLRGLTIPVVYNSSGYESVGTLRQLDGLVDIYLPDMKYSRTETAAKYSTAPDYAEVAKRALQEMVRQAGALEFDRDGMMRKGVIVRHLLLPGHVTEAKEVLDYLYHTYGDLIYISIMNQYTPLLSMRGLASVYPELDRKVTKREYDKVIDHALELGIRNAFVQEGETAAESYIPAFDGEGILR
ncbi:MAG: radical SAM protein [Lachnospiraceae bacterium]|nr:radical SAM protein [Lachnospiraceae bacterium]